MPFGSAHRLGREERSRQDTAWHIAYLAHSLLGELRLVALRRPLRGLRLFLQLFGQDLGLEFGCNLRAVSSVGANIKPYLHP